MGSGVGMVEYIEKQALIEGMVKVDGRKWSTKTLGEVLDAIGSIEIVRCKDCKHCIGLDNNKYCHCKVWGRVSVLDGFCHKGKRIEE